MGYPRKIATCCYCGTRAALTLDSGRHELACSSCGAPLHDLKTMPVRDHPMHPSEPLRAKRKRKKGKTPRPYEQSWPPRPAPGRRRKSLMRRIFEEAEDILEEIFD